MARIVYMDESGVSPDNKVMVVVGVFVEADKQLPLLEEAIRSVVAPYVTPEYLENYVVHATELSAGNLKLPPELRDNPAVANAILDGMVAIPKALGLGLFVASVWWEQFDDRQLMKPHEKRVTMQNTAMALVSSAVDGFMVRRFPDEVAWIVAENNDEVRKSAAALHREMNSSRAQYYRGLIRTEYVPFTKVKDGLNFALKADSPALQLADVCAWAIRRWYAVRDDRAVRFYAPLESQIYVDSGTSLDVTKKYAAPLLPDVQIAWTADTIKTRDRR